VIAPVFTICASSAAVRECLGDSPVRLYPFGMTDDILVYPYAVWQNISGAPGMYLDRVPDYDAYSVQIDVYGDTDSDVISAAVALRDAIEPRGYVTRWGNQGRNPDTLKYRYSFDVDFIVNR
jgi:hypothetical protein